MIPPVLILACSGKGAGLFIAENQRWTMVHACVGWVLVAHMLFLALRYRKAKWPLLACGLLMLFHPVFTMDAVSDDCGFRMMQASEISTVILAGLPVAQVWMKGRNSK